MTEQSENLVAEPKSNPEDDPKNQWAKGAGPLDSGFSFIADLSKGESWETLAVDLAAFGLDALAVVMNPLGELVKAGVGWLLEHLAFLREPLEVLTGDPAAIEAIAQTWNNIADEMDVATEDYRAALTATSGWQGEASLTYQTLARSYVEALSHIAAQARDAAKGVTTAGIVVATTRAIIFDIIATFISNVITRALLAAASSWFTFGASVAAFIASTTADAALLMARIQKHIGKLLATLQRFVKNFNVLGASSAKAAKALGRKSTELGTQANKAIKSASETLDSVAPAAGRAKTYANYIEGEGTSVIAQRLGAGSTVGKVVSHDATRLAKETAKSAKDQADQYSGGSEDDGRIHRD